MVVGNAGDSGSGNRPSSELPPGPLVLLSPDQTRGWVRAVFPGGVEGYRLPDGTEWVGARDDEPHQIEVRFTKIRGLPPLRLVPVTTSWRAQGAARRERRAARELRVRGY